jgi:hypothetical protein
MAASICLLFLFGLSVTALTASALEQAARREVERAHPSEVATRHAPR